MIDGSGVGKTEEGGSVKRGGQKVKHSRLVTMARNTESAKLKRDCHITGSMR